MRNLSMVPSRASGGLCIAIMMAMKLALRLPKKINIGTPYLISWLDNSITA